MPLFDFECPKCHKLFEDLIYKEEPIKSPCCGEPSNKANKQSRIFSFKMGASKKFEIKKDRPDSGAPFGSVPGDEIFTNPEGKQPGDIGYRGPIP